jgi:hypothetical protein
VTRDRADVAWLARVVAERAPQGSHGLAERAVRHDHVGPHAVEDQPAAHRFVPARYEQQQQVEIARDERHFAPVLEQQPPRGRQDERPEPVTRIIRDSRSSAGERARSGTTSYG